MLFSSITFLFYFLPCTLLIYFISPKKLKNTVLLIASLIFYAWGGVKYLLLISAEIIAGYISGLLIEKFRDRKLSKIVMWIQSAFIIGCLGFFKYADFFIKNFNTATGNSVPLLKIILPVGISFYTFQILSYTADVYRKSVKAQKNIVNLALYISLFPQLIAGPIVRYSDIAPQLEARTHSVSKSAQGIRLFVCGLAKKVLIANALGELCGHCSDGERSLLSCWIYAVSFSLQIYFDFSGYSDMAVGLGKIFGFELCQNFDHPFISSSATEFWRRWHMSLGTWFRDYVYIPMGGNRVSKPRWLFNIFVVWMLTGFWHGASWNFMIWGLYFAVFLVAEKLFLLEYLKKSKILSHIYLLFIVVISFVIFSFDDMGTAAGFISGMFGTGGLPLISDESVYYLNSFKFILASAIIGSTPLPAMLLKKLRGTKRLSYAVNAAEPLVIAVIMISVTAYLVDGSFNPFLYFRF